MIIFIFVTEYMALVYSSIITSLYKLCKSKLDIQQMQKIVVPKCNLNLHNSNHEYMSFLKITNDFFKIQMPNLIFKSRYKIIFLLIRCLTLIT